MRPDTDVLDRVERSTARHVNRRIRAQTAASIRYHGRYPDRIPARVRDLRREWDIERVFETGSSAWTLLGLGLGILVDRRFLAISVLVQGFVMLHAIQGWAPPIPVLRRLGVRTQREITEERLALEALDVERDPSVHGLA